MAFVCTIYRYSEKAIRIMANENEGAAAGE